MWGDLSKVKLLREKGRVAHEMQPSLNKRTGWVIEKLGGGVKRFSSMRERQTLFIIACVDFRVEDSNDLIEIFIKINDIKLVLNIIQGIANAGDRDLLVFFCLEPLIITFCGGGSSLTTSHSVA